MDTLAIGPAGLAAPTVDVSPAKLNAGASSGSISAFNWARWEQKLRDTRRKEQWQAEIKKIEGTRTHIWGSEDCVPKPSLASFEYNRAWRFTHVYGFGKRWGLQARQ